MSIKKQIRKLREYKSNVESYVMKGKEDLNQSQEALDYSMQTAKETQQEISNKAKEEQVSLEKTINTSYDAQAKLSETVDDAKTKQGKLTELTGLVSKIESKYQTEIAALKAQNKELLQKEYSLESVTQQITKDQDAFKKRQFKKLTQGLEDLGKLNFESGRGILNSYGRIQDKVFDKETTDYFNWAGGDVRLDENTSRNISFHSGNGYVFFTPKSTDDVAVRFNMGRHENSSTVKEILQSPELQTLIDIKLFDVLLGLQNKEYIVAAKDHAYKAITPENESAFAATLQTYLDKKSYLIDDLEIRETFQDFVPKYKDNKK